MLGLKLSLPPQTKFAPKLSKLWLVGIGLAAIGLVSLVVVIISFRQTALVVKLVKQQNFVEAHKAANQAKILPTTLSIITLRQSATIESWRLALNSVDELENFSGQLNFVGRHLLDQAQPAANLIALEKSWRNLLDQTTQLEKQMQKSQWLRRSDFLESLTTLNQAGADLLTLNNYLATGKKQIIILFQNTEEIRATGGFMGSYARLVFEAGKITNLEIQDIYEPDGQFRGFVDAPPGAKEYLSGGQGLRLPDANWQPDFPSSAKTIATYFAFGHERDIDLLVTLNVDLVEKVLKIVGDIYLPDYGLTAGADNLTDLAHADRNAFFAGSKQKVNFLSSLFNNLKFKLTTLSNQQVQSLLQTTQIALSKKDIQFFAWEEEIQSLFLKHQVAGALTRPASADLFFAQVESNVGINKANKKISRTVTLEIRPNSTTATTYFHNDDQNSRENYINYHRFYLDPAVKVREIAFGGQTLTTYDQQLITTAEQETFNQIGVLVTVPAGASRELTLVIDYPTLCQAQTCQLALIKQSGLPATPHTIATADQTQNLILEQDELIELHQL